MNFGKVFKFSAEGCQERFPDWTFLRYVWTFNTEKKPGIDRIINKYKDTKKFFIIKNNSDIQKVMGFLKNYSTVIREATMYDTKILEELFLLTRQATFISRSPESFKMSDYKKSVEGEEVWVAEYDGKIVGFISLWVPDNFIHNLFIHPDYQRRGIGSDLLEIAEKRLIFPMTLKIAMDNLQACKFYEKHGWHKVSIYNNRDSESYILYKKDFIK